MTSPLELLMVSPAYPPFVGGTEIHTAEVSRRLVQRGHAVTVLTTDRSARHTSRAVREGVEVVTVPARPRNRDWFFAPGIGQVVRESRWDLVHVQGYHTFVAPFAMSAALKSHTPYVLTFHSGGHDSALRRAVRPVQRAALRNLLRHADHLIGVSRYEADFFAQKLGLPSDAISVVSNGVSPGFLVPPPRAAVPGRVICSIGRLEHYKGHHRLIRAMPDLLRQDPRVRLVMVGAGSYRPQLERMVTALGLSDSVEFRYFPHEERDALASFLANAALVVSLSEHESQGMGVLEALSVGAPVLANDSTALKELGAAGLVSLAPPRCTAAHLADILLHCLDEARPVAPLAPPTWDATTDAVERIYRGVLARRQRDLRGLHAHTAEGGAEVAQARDTGPAA